MLEFFPANAIEMSVKITNLNMASNQIQKANYSPTESSKYFISRCQERINEQGNTKGWLKVVRTLQLVRNYDKSRVLLSVLNKNLEVVAKLGGSNLVNEYAIANILRKEQGFIKFMCFFKCNDSFSKYPSKNQEYMCDGKGNSMHVIVMPFYPAGSLADYPWRQENLDTLKSCIKQSTYYITRLYEKFGIVHNDFHPRNVLLTSSPRKKFKYENVPILGLEVVIMDFENSYKSKMTSFDIQNFYYDLKKFFMLLPTFIPKIDKASLIPIDKYINDLNMKNEKPDYKLLPPLYRLVDKIKLQP